MTRLLGVAALLLVLATAGCGRNAASLNNEGNEAFRSQEYGAALQAYNQAQLESPDLAEPVYNAGNSHYRQRGWEDAQQSYEKALSIAEGELAQSATFNLGNVLFNADSLEEAIEAYKQALRMNPDDADAKHNLELALRKQQEEQQDEEEEDGQSQAQNQPDEEPESGEEDQPSGSQDQSAGGQQGQDEQDNGRRGPPQTQELTEEQARQLLEAVGGNVGTLRGQSLRDEPPSGRPPARDW